MAKENLEEHKSLHAEERKNILREAEDTRRQYLESLDLILSIVRDTRKTQDALCWELRP